MNYKFKPLKNLHLMKDTGKGWNRQRQIWLNLGEILLHLCMLQKMFLNPLGTRICRKGLCLCFER